MKKRIITAIAILLVLALAALYFIPSVDQRQVLVLSPIIRAARELNSPVEWERWNPALKKDCLENPGGCAVKNSPEQNTFTVQVPHCSISVVARGAMFDITRTGNNNAATYNYTLVPSLHDDSTKLIVTAKASLLSSLFSSLSSSVALQDADSLKKFIETPSDYYGFQLQMVSSVVDTCVVVTHKRVLAANRATETKILYNSIDSFISANHLIITQPNIAHYQPAAKDSVDITVGKPVDKPSAPVGFLKTMLLGSPQNNFAFMQMPAHGKMLVGYYKGRFGDRMKLYRAMDRFMSDKLQKIIALPYEKYLNNTVPENDSTVVEIKVYYPVI